MFRLLSQHAYWQVDIKGALVFLALDSKVIIFHLGKRKKEKFPPRIDNQMSSINYPLRVSPPSLL